MATTHKLVDGKKNTLLIAKSNQNRRFGGFTTIPWDNSSQYKDDKVAFLFSLDKMKIYPYKNQGHAIYCSSDRFAFGYSHDFYIRNKFFQGNNSQTYETNNNTRYEFFGDSNGISEDGKASYITLKEVEIFEVLFD